MQIYVITMLHSHQTESVQALVPGSPGSPGRWVKSSVVPWLHIAASVVPCFFHMFQPQPCFSGEVVSTRHGLSYDQQPWYIMENPILRHDLGVPLFQETSIWLCYGLPSGKQPQNYGKSPFFMGQLRDFLWPLWIAMLNYQRVTIEKNKDFL